MPVRPRILVLGAWAPELDPLRDVASDGLVLRAIGIGAVEAAVGAARAIAETRPAAVVFSGTAGAYPAAADALPMGAAVVVGTAHLMSTAALAGASYLPRPLVTRTATNPDLRRRLSRASGAGTCDVTCPLAITSSAVLARRIARATGAEVENLEVFAAARAADAASLPFAAVLGIANVVGPRAHTQWKRHHREASRAACDAVLAWLSS